MAFTDDFNRADSTTVGNGWIERVDSRWEILNNQLRFPSTGGDYRDIQCLRPASENFANGTISVEFTRSATDQAPQVHGRFTANYFYTAWVYYGTLYLSKVINRTKTDLGSAASVTITNGVAYKLSLIMSGTTITARLHRVSDGVLLSEVIRTDSSITNPGQHGVSGATTAPFTMDNYYSALTIDNTVSETDSGAGADEFSVTDTSGTKSPYDSAYGTESIGISAAAPVVDFGAGQDSVSIAVFVNVGDSGTGDDLPTIAEPAMLGLLERFDGTLADWTLDTSGGSVQIQTVNNDEKLVLNDTSATAIVSATRSIEGQSAPFCIEADIYAATGAIGLLEALDAGGNAVFSIRTDAGAGQGTFDTDNDTPSTFGFSAGAYYQIVLYCNTLNDTVQAWYITGTGASPSVWTAAGSAKSYSGALVSKIRLSTDQAATGEARFDELKVFRPHVFCIGDSNTAGYKASSPYWNPVPSSGQRLGIGEDEEHSYPHWLGLKFVPDQWAVNRGLNSDQSSHVDGRIQSDVIDQGAQTVVILIGTNDITAGVALATIESNIQSAANKASAAGLTVCLCSVPPRNAWDSTQNTKRTSLNAWILSPCTANGYRFADVYAAVKDSVDPNILNPAYDAGDGLHFTTTGLQVIADTVYSALIETKAITDTASGADSVEVRNSVFLSETGQGEDICALRNFISLSDSGAGTDTLNIFAAIQLLELASVVEGLAAGGTPEFHSVTESGTGVDSVSAIIKQGATLQDIYDLTLTRLASAAYVVPDNAGIMSLLAHAVSMSKWKNNKLARTAAVGRVETWVLYDDDGQTPLLTWTHDTSTMTREKAY
ncbi:MAG: hypothetical protein HYV23_06925 [Deltaproteobacteria bacterium]|nr:hypothetical protein [Deltaproteobacteria bacterium]